MADLVLLDASNSIDITQGFNHVPGGSGNAGNPSIAKVSGAYRWVASYNAEYNAPGCTDTPNVLINDQRLLQKYTSVSITYSFSRSSPRSWTQGLAFYFSNIINEKSTLIYDDSGGNGSATNKTVTADIPEAAKYIMVSMGSTNDTNGSQTVTVSKIVLVGEKDPGEEKVQKDFIYTGSVESWTVPKSGTYKLEVWGCKGESANNGNTKGGKGGYSVGYKKLKKNDVIYVCCGGNNYNGGGASQSEARPWPSWEDDQYWYSYGVGKGGGATHIALVTGTLADIGKTTFDQKGLIVAGGGGAAAGGNGSYFTGGAGGGTSGASSQRGATGGTQSGGYAFGQGNTGAGGGYYGGNGTIDGGAGGSGWIDGVSDLNAGNPKSTSQNIWDSTGKALVTLMSGGGGHLGELDCEVFLGEQDISSIHLGELDVD